jgi:pilus assembly protein Flp/PilA
MCFGACLDGWSLWRHLILQGEREMKKFMSRFVSNESGATAIEYGLIAALIAVALIGALQLIGNNMADNYNTIGDAMSGS